LCDVASANGITCAVVSQPGKHDWPFAAQAFAASLPWLASTLGTPGIEAVQLPQGSGGEPH
ncbi:MAG TPA: esterase family protein, partial [Mycobacterium sp.]